MGNLFGKEQDTSVIEQEVIRYDQEEEPFSIEMVEYFLRDLLRAIKEDPAEITPEAQALIFEIVDEIEKTVVRNSVTQFVEDLNEDNLKEGEIYKGLQSLSTESHQSLEMMLYIISQDSSNTLKGNDSEKRSGE